MTQRAPSRFLHVGLIYSCQKSMSNYIDVHIKNLRRKVDDTDGRIIRTIRGVGYIVKEDS